MASASARPMGVWMCTALVVGNMIGSGVFMLPASLAPLGWNAIVGWLLTIGGTMCLAFVFARLARAIPRAGGPFAYTEAAFGRGPGFLIAWSYWTSVPVTNAALAIAAVSYLSVFAPALTTTPGLAGGLAIAFVWLATLINCLGARSAGWTQLVTTVLKLTPLVAVTGVAAYVLATKGPSAVAPFHPAALSGGGVTTAAALTLWALLGVETAGIPAEQVDNPARTVPFATLVGTGVTGAIYLMVFSGVLLLTPIAVLSGSNAPLADFMAYHGVGDLRLPLAAFAAISALGALNGWVLIQGEMPAAMARDGVFPAWFGKAASNGAPVRAHVASSVVVTILLVMNYAKSLADAFTFMALLATAATLFAYLACALAALRLQGRGLERSRVLTAVAVVGAVYSVWTFYGAGASASFWGLVLLASGAPIYWLVRRTKR